MKDAMDDQPSTLRARLAGKRRTVGVPDAGQGPGEGTPLFSDADTARVLTAPQPGLSLQAWFALHAESLNRTLHTHGALLLRGFSVAGPGEFGAIVRGLGDALPYVYRSTPRTEVAAEIYTSTEYPASEQIPLHNENAYASSWPLRIAFHCVLAAERGGATPIADSRRVLAALDPAVRQRFEDRGVMYVRNFHGSVDLSWQTAFQTERREDVESYCRAAGIGFEWRDGGRLRTRQVCPAIRIHPGNGQAVWFNQAHLFHPSALEPSAEAALRAAFAEDDLPRNACYGDGSPIEADALESIREAFGSQIRRFDWVADDVLLLDNMLYAHGRDPFCGARRVHVGMVSACSGAPA
ncbi:TauD/TfdA family dioxygenase [Xanthomonas campestris pv. campestris]|nr:TauD/TfdA family dioxygenase [Xanthomonas campestris pv. campestris]MEB1308990.1 TauD/TfdA family dioxygenase [Xanthomonas campestris pv. campestris]